ncbi:MAG TPA: hypothetical protein VEK57_30080, partial [Thermoanaerobaculia bacterium]|nr:hypothetical protein [Thermoanaerobaculia bacterium]
EQKGRAGSCSVARSAGWKKWPRLTRPKGRAYRSFTAFGGSRKINGHLFPGSGTQSLAPDSMLKRTAFTLDDGRLRAHHESPSPSMTTAFRLTRTAATLITTAFTVITNHLHR